MRYNGGKTPTEYLNNRSSFEQDKQVFFEGERPVSQC